MSLLRGARFPWNRPGSILALAAVLTACQGTQLSLPLLGCPPWGCGTNGAWLGQNVVFHELDASGKKANDAGLVLVAFSAPEGGESLQLNVDGDKLQGTRRDGSVVEGKKLAGAVLRLRGGQTEYDLKIVGVGSTDFWAGSRSQVTVYELKFAPPNGPGDVWLPLCRETTENGFEGIHGFALIFRGDRYDAQQKTVSETGAKDTWFNIACAGTALAKMHLLRHTLAGRDPAHEPTSVDERQAVLKMLTADYCGTGKPFTISGLPLLYTYNQQNWIRVDAALNSTLFQAGLGKATAKSLDAIWNQKGAVCLDTPRLQLLLPSIRNDIDLECKKTQRDLKPCSSWGGWASPWSWSPLGYAVSANP
jgi:hypothetical protein